MGNSANYRTLALPLITMDDFADVLPSSLRETLGLNCPNFCLQNDEQITLTALPDYVFLQAYALGYHGTAATLQALAYCDQFMPAHDLITGWVPNMSHLRYYDDEMQTLFK